MQVYRKFLIVWRKFLRENVCVWEKNRVKEMCDKEFSLKNVILMSDERWSLKNTTCIYSFKISLFKLWHRILFQFSFICTWSFYKFYHLSRFHWCKNCITQFAQRTMSFQFWWFLFVIPFSPVELSDKIIALQKAT